LSQEQQFILAFETAQKMNLITEDFDIEQANYLWQVYQKNINALNAYQPQPYAGQVTLFQATENVLTQEMTNNLNKWTNLATNGINIYSVTSNHYLIVRPPFVADLASSIKQCLKNIK
jgi:thioesterase domain-containing protein